LLYCHQWYDTEIAKQISDLPEPNVMIIAGKLTRSTSLTVHCKH
jgi:hypothetical protein